VLIDRLYTQQAAQEDDRALFDNTTTEEMAEGSITKHTKSILQNPYD